METWTTIRGPLVAYFVPYPFVESNESHAALLEGKGPWESGSIVRPNWYPFGLLG